MSLESIVDRFEGRRVVVLGDLAVDCYVETRPSRLSREAPVLVLRYEGRRCRPGCASNTVMNLRSLGAEVIPIGVVGDDEYGATLREIFREAGVSDAGLASGGQSVVKVRLMSGDVSRPQQQLLRIDVEPEGGLDVESRARLLASAAAAEGAEAIVVSDYDYGSASPELLQAVRAAAPEALVSIDSHTHIDAFDGADLLTPNEWEAAEFLNRRVETDEEAAAAAHALKERTGASAVLLTRGNRGMILAEEETHLLPITGSEEIVDPSGAGDTVVSTATLARVVGASYLDAARLAIHAAGVTVMKAGAEGLTREELKEAIRHG
jgi:rfaE bifunctional protein kinase chain/domain